MARKEWEAKNFQLVTGKKVTAGRLNFLRAIIVIILLALIVRLAWVQLIIGPNLSAQAEDQRRVTVAVTAKRGTITDTNGTVLAYTMPSGLLSIHPNKVREFEEQLHTLYPDDYPPADQRMADLANDLPTMAKGAINKPADAPANNPTATIVDDSATILKKLQSDESYAVLARGVDPDKAAAIVKKYPEITLERQDIRQYPNGAIGENILGKVSQEGDGQFGLELSQDDNLQGIDGSYIVDIASQGMTIPGSRRDDKPATDGDNYQLTIDNEMQTFVQQALEQAKTNSGAKDASAVVLDAKTGEILTMATTGTIDPTGNLDAQLEAGKEFGNRTISDPFEPGSVAKVMTAAAAIEEGKASPDEVFTVPGSINMAGVTVRDAWVHGNVDYTMTGIFAKSSNVGTLMIAQRLGQATYADYFHRFGLGQETGVELPGESAGYLPDESTWEQGTMANLPIGQGFSISLLQMADIYQAIANDGVRIQPRIVKKVTKADGTEVPQPAPAENRVVSAQTAKTVRDMLRGVVQKDNGWQSGTGPAAAVAGYQITGKTGTAQQVDPNTKAYSNSMYWITFAGIAPADNPRFVVALMLNNPQRGVHGEGGQSAAPLFHDIAAWALNHYNVAPSAEAAPKLKLQVN